MFPEKITPYYRALMENSASDASLRRMVCYSPEEEASAAGENNDPTGEDFFTHGKLVHRYPNRALLLVTGRCAAHCRFCFRRGKMANWEDITDTELAMVLDYIQEHREIEEIILTGGDPLALSNSRLINIIKAIKELNQQMFIRVHTRFPTYEPTRCEGIAALAMLVDVFVLHINHPGEITIETERILQALRQYSKLFNQSVLLRGVNDSVETLAELSKALFRLGVVPYYLHYPDAAPGIAHFRPPLADAIKIIEALNTRIAGYLVPRLLVDSVGKGKRIVRDTDSCHKC